jgi:hypothetical protein
MVPGWRLLMADDDVNPILAKLREVTGDDTIGFEKVEDAEPVEGAPISIERLPDGDYAVSYAEYTGFGTPNEKGLVVCDFVALRVTIQGGAASDIAEERREPPHGQDWLAELRQFHTQWVSAWQGS